MAKWLDGKGNETRAFKLPNYYSVNCLAYEANSECEYYGYGYIEGGWDGALCFHPKAKGNKTGWLINCPIKEVQSNG